MVVACYVDEIIVHMSNLHSKKHIRNAMRVRIFPEKNQWRYHDKKAYRLVNKNL